MSKMIRRHRWLPFTTAGEPGIYVLCSYCGQMTNDPQGVMRSECEKGDLIDIEPTTNWEQFSKFISERTQMDMFWRTAYVLKNGGSIYECATCGAVLVVKSTIYEIELKGCPSSDQRGLHTMLIRVSGVDLVELPTKKD